MYPAGQVPTPAAAPSAPVAPIAAPAAAPSPTPAPPIDRISESGVQGALHPGSFDPAPSPEAAVAAAQAALAAASTNAAAVAATQLPPGVSPESAAVSSSARALAAQMGFQAANRFGTDNEFMTALLGQAQAASQAQQQLQAFQASQLAAQQAQVHAAQQAAAAAQPQPAAAKWWNPPEFNPAWSGMVKRNEHGVVEALPGVPAEIAAKVSAYESYKRDFADRFLSNPETTLLPMVNAAADDRARDIIRRELQEQQNAQYISGFVEANKGWLHARDASGQVVTNPQTGRPVLSPTGRAFQGHVNAAQQIGIADIRAQEQYAKSMMQRDYLQQQYQEAQAQQQAQAAVLGANRIPSQSGAIPQAGIAPPPTAGASLAQQMALAFAANGITDAAFEAR